MTPSDIRKKAEETLAAMYFIVGPVDHYQENVAYIESALLETYSVGKDDGEQAGFEKGTTKAIEVFKNHYGDKLCFCKNSMVQHYPWNELLLPQKDK